MTKGELKKITLALHNIAMVEDNINNAELWSTVVSGTTNGLALVKMLNDAINMLGSVIVEGTEVTK